MAQRSGVLTTGNESAERQRRLWAIYGDYSRDPALAKVRTTHDGKTKSLVPGRGTMFPRVVFVGEAPGRREAITRKPFTGPAGEVFNELLEIAGLRRDQVFVTNTVKYRPTVDERGYRNRTPSSSEIRASIPYLMRELAVFPGVPVVTMGNVALRACTGDLSARVTSFHGQRWYDAYREYLCWYHPACIVYEDTMRPIMTADVVHLRALIAA